MPESAREFWDRWIKENFWGCSLIGQRMEQFAEAYASSRVAALEQRIADAVAILDQAGDNRDEALYILRQNE